MEALKRVSPSVVRIQTDKSTGSGVIYKVDETTNSARVITNYHVVEDANSIMVVASNLRYAGKLLGYNAIVDLALIEICCDADFAAAFLTDERTVSVGDQVYALGYPLGTTSVRATGGIVSAIEYETRYARRQIQTDAAINPGNSGGPLILADGNVIGINTSKIEETRDGRPVEGFGFAISSETVLAQLPSLEMGKYLAAPIPTAVSPDPAPPAAETPAPSTGELQRYFLESGELVHEDDGFIEEHLVWSEVRNFQIQVDFEAPYGPVVGAWSMGFVFRDDSFGNLSYVVMTNMGECSHYVGRNRQAAFIGECSAADLRTDVGAKNTVALVAVEDRGWLFINSVFAGKLDLSGSHSTGELSIATGLYSDAEVPGYSTKFSMLEARELGVLSGPHDGELAKSDSAIAAYRAEVDAASAYVSVKFEVPPGSMDWSSGLMFRDKSDEDYLLLAIEDAGFWSVHHASLTGDGLRILAEGHSDSIDIVHPILNDVELIFLGNMAVVYVNGELMGTADVGSIVHSGDVAAAYGFFRGDEANTGKFSEFIVWGHR